MLAPITHILPITFIRRERVLPSPGKVLVRAGQKVSASDVIAEANLYPEYVLLDVARGLGLSAEQAERHIQCRAGDQLAEGDIVAGPLGLARRVIRCSRDGRVALAGGGQVLIETTGKPFQLKAGLPGEVVELIPDRGAVIETTGALIQGVWGNGHADFGVMAVLAKQPDHVLTPEQLDVSLRGAIVLAGHCENPEVFKSAEELPLRGLILASISPALTSVALKTQVAVVLIEGFGRRALNSVAYKLLSTNERREVALNAERWDRHMGVRPEIIIQLPGMERVSPPQDTGFFNANQRVRVVRLPHVGEIGEIQELAGIKVFPSGIKAQAAKVQLESGETIILPLNNLEALA